MKKISLLFALVLLFGSTMTAFAHRGENEYKANLQPLNRSGVTGKAELTLVGDQLTVEIEAMGLEPNMTHAQHIHGFADNRNASCPNPTADTNGNHIVEFAEGLPYYGPVILPLTPFSTTPAGKLEYKATFTVDPSQFNPLENRTIVLHGMTVDGTYVPSLPVACAQIRVHP